MTPSGGDTDIVGALNAIVAAISGGGGGEAGGGGRVIDLETIPVKVIDDGVNPIYSSDDTPLWFYYDGDTTMLQAPAYFVPYEPNAGDVLRRGGASESTQNLLLSSRKIIVDIDEEGESRKGDAKVQAGSWCLVKGTVYIVLEGDQKSTTFVSSDAVVEFRNNPAPKK